MSRLSSISTQAGCVCALALLAGTASAHIHLLDPLPRYPDEVSGENKNCPCGVGTGGRSCTKPEERSDLNRSSDRATALLGGSMLTVRLDEYVGHSGRYRIAFDPDGADVADFNQHILADIPDPSGNRGNSGDGSIWEIAARLPNMDCENCTLQVVQVMNGDTDDPVADTVGQSTYYQCADLVLTKDDSLPEGYAAPSVLGAATGVSEGDGMDMATGSPPGMPAMPSSSTPVVPNSVSAGMPSGDDASAGGCSLGHLPTGSGWQPLGVLAVALAYCSRRGRRSPALARASL